MFYIFSFTLFLGKRKQNHREKERRRSEEKEGFGRTDGSFKTDKYCEKSGGDNQAKVSAIRSISFVIWTKCGLLNSINS